MTTKDGKELLRGLKNERPGAFRELVDLHRERVLNTCYRFTHDRQDAEDVAQEVFIEAHRSVAGFRGEAKLSTWLYRIAVTKSLDFVRRKNRKKRFGAVRGLFVFGGEAELIPAPPDGRPDMEAERRERYGILWEALDTLPENQRAAIVLSKYQGFSQREVAGILGTTVASVEALIQRAKKKLRKKLVRRYGKKLKKGEGFSMERTS